MGVGDMKRKPYIVLTNGNTLEPQRVMPSALNDLYNRNRHGEPPTKAPFFSTQFEAELMDDILRLQKENEQLKKELAKLNGSR